MAREAEGISRNYLDSRLKDLEKKTEEIEKFANVCFLPRVAQEAMSFGEMKKSFYEDLRKIRGKIPEKELRYFYQKVIELTHRADRAIMETFRECNYSKKG